MANYFSSSPNSSKLGTQHQHHSSSSSTSSKKYSIHVDPSASSRTISSPTNNSPSHKMPSPNSISYHPPTSSPLSPSHENETSFSYERSKISDPGEWLIWCQENKVLKQNVDLVHYEFETCRRHFNTLKFQASDDGVHPKTLADSFYKAELFPTFNEALQYCSKLREDDNLITYSDLLDATQCKNGYRRNKARLYVKFVASSDLFLKALHAHEASYLLPNNSTNCEDNHGNGSSEKTILQSMSSIDIYSTPHSITDPNGKLERITTKRLDSVSENQNTQNTNQAHEPILQQYSQQQQLPPHHPHYSQSHTQQNTQQQQNKSQQPPLQQQTSMDNNNKGSKNRLLENGRRVLVRLYSNATEMINGIFEKPPAVTTTGTGNGTGTGSVDQPSRAPTRRQESRDNGGGNGPGAGGGGGFLKFLSRSFSRAQSFGESDHLMNPPPRTIVENELLTEEKNSSLEVVSMDTPASRAVLQKLDSVGDNTAVKPKRASIKIYTNGQFTHAFPARNCRVAAGFEESGSS